MFEPAGEPFLLLREAARSCGWLGVRLALARALQVILIVAGLPTATLWADRALAQATGRRVALVVGNSQYVNVSRLLNTGNDAQLIAKTLQGLNFALVGGKALIDLDRASFQKAIRNFSDQLTTAEVGLFYYAGHGLQVRGVNYLVPIDANPSKPADVEFELVDASLILRVMESGGSKLNLMILDACRNNPFGGRGLREVTSGLAETKVPRGTLISYATQPGNVASDGGAGARDSPYTLALAEAMRTPGLDLFQVFNRVGLIVDRETDGAQLPWVSSSPIEGTFYFAALPPAPPPSPPPPPAAPIPDKEVVFWQSIKDSSNPADFEAYLAQYPSGAFGTLARNRLRAIEGQREAALPPAAPAPPPPAPATQDVNHSDAPEVAAAKVSPPAHPATAPERIPGETAQAVGASPSPSPAATGQISALSPPSESAVVPVRPPAAPSGPFDGQWKGSGSASGPCRANGLFASGATDIALTTVGNKVSGKADSWKGTLAVSGEIKADGSFIGKIGTDDIAGKFDGDEFRGTYLLSSTAPGCQQGVVSLKRIKP